MSHHEIVIVGTAFAVPPSLRRPVVHGAAVEAPRAARLGAEERVAGPHLTAGRRRLEQERKRGSAQGGKGRHGRRDIEKNLFRNRNEMPFAGAGSKLFVGHECDAATY